MSLNFEGKVAIVTGSGGGIGKGYALELAKRGAKVVVNDIGGAVDGSGGSLTAAETVVQEIEANGGEAMANGANVCSQEDVKAMVDAAMEKWGRVDVLINNAGILRDKSFAKMDWDDFVAVVNVHLLGSAVFVDLGNVFSTNCNAYQTECFAPDFKELRGSYGIGGSAITPFGPISVYVAIPFNNGPLDRTKRFEFTVGNKF